ncbi:1,4-dihydroxy-2-naphthoate polyprenyltransferase [Arachnia propionica]|uniref:1,4-dihydroxy-2-naphthoate octaprenyltransferase n=1 Tax=Arachnia propionica TaxID=1750 RepID=A0A3P1T2S2_9ACTN|nr:1,4-dihydroxy-2-naphthoate polyprenyltransferase [Arachnia propionica]RRD03817.1 1,4-dihydroxy-2-naphthoate polyprenyltransferase [Arachnia propionica]
MNPSIWVAGARPRTLPAAAAPILAGVAAGVGSGQAVPLWRLLLVPALCAIVALALQVGVNYANDYSDGIRGTDDVRVGPTRLTASGLARPGTVRNAAFISFAVAAVTGLVVVAISGTWWLLAVGALAILAAWYYTGGRRPYGYLGLGELMVFIFFGLVATVGTTHVTFHAVPPATWAAATGVGALASALLVVNNLRDLAADAEVGKRTLATRIGDRATRWFFVSLLVVGFISTLAFAGLTTPWALLGLVGFVVLLAPVARLLAGAVGRDLIAMLQATSLTELALAFGLLIGVAVGS